MSVDGAAARMVERLTLPSDGGLILAAIDGMGGSGKSTLAQSVADACPGRITLIHGDDFYRPEERDWRSWTPQQGYQRYFDHQHLERELLRPLKRGEAGRFQRYDWASKALDGWVHVEPTGVVLVEGVYLLRPRLRRYWDLSVFVDTPREMRLSRAYARGENDAGWIEKWAAAEDYYLAVDDPAHWSDLVVRGY